MSWDLGFVKQFWISNDLEWFINKTIEEFLTPPEDESIRLPYCQQNASETGKFIRKLSLFTQGHFKFRIVWSTRQVRSLFKLKDKVSHVSNVVYLGTCITCKADYVGETARNFDVRRSEHEDLKHNSEPARHLATKSILLTGKFCQPTKHTGSTENSWKQFTLQISNHAWTNKFTLLNCPFSPRA